RLTLVDHQFGSDPELVVVPVDEAAGRRVVQWRRVEVGAVSLDEVVVEVLAPEEVRKARDLVLAHERTLQTHGLYQARLVEEHVAEADETLGAHAIEDGARVVAA